MLYSFKYVEDIIPTTKVVSAFSRDLKFSDESPLFSDWVMDNYRVVSSLGLAISEYVMMGISKKFPYIEKLSRGRTKVSATRDGVAISLYYKHSNGKMVESVSLEDIKDKVTTNFRYSKVRGELNKGEMSYVDMLFEIIHQIYVGLLHDFVINHNVDEINKKIKTNGGYQLKLVRTANYRIISRIRQDYLELKVDEVAFREMGETEEVVDYYNEQPDIVVDDFNVLQVLKNTENKLTSISNLVKHSSSEMKRYKGISIIKEEITELNPKLKQSSIMVRDLQTILGEQKLCIYEKGYKEPDVYTKVLQIDLTTNDIDRLVL